MKSQAMPIRTVVLIVIIIVSIAAILLFFYSSFSRTRTSASEQSYVTECQQICSRIQASNPKSSTDLSTLDGDWNSKVFPNNKHCYDITGCTVYLTDGTKCSSNIGRSGFTC